MFPNDMWIANPNPGGSPSGQLFKFENELSTLTTSCEANASCIMVSQNMLSTYVSSISGNIVSRFDNGVHVVDIPVGSIPYSMCEDGHGNIYVCNYGENTISKIVNDVVVKTIHTPSGPRDIVSDKHNNIFVACYLSNSVIQIVNDIIVDEIECKLSPRAITCDAFNNIWVANYASNTISKIVNSHKILDIDLKDIARGPVDILSDAKGNIYVAGYLGNVVVRIESSNNNNYDIIPVNPGPTSLSLTLTNDVYVTSEVDGVICKISGSSKTVVKTINTCQNPVGFGDNTGCSTYNIFHDGSGASGPNVPTGGWGMGAMSSEIQNLLGKVKTKTVETTANLVGYHSSAYPTVEAALDNLLNITPIINNFKVANDTYEIGSAVTTMQISWEFNKPMSTAVVKYGSAVIADLAPTPGAPIPMIGTIIITGFSISGTPTNRIQYITLDTYDENGINVSKSIPLYFENKFLFGSLPDTTTFVGQTELDTLSKSPLVGSVDKAYDKHFMIDCGFAGDQLPCIAVPSAWAIDERQIAFLNGYANDWTKIPNINYTNASGQTEQFDIFLFNQPLAGEIVAHLVNIINI